MIAHLVELPVTGQNSFGKAWGYSRRVFERVGAAIGSIDALERQVSASLTWCLTVTFDFAPLAFIAVIVYINEAVSFQTPLEDTYHAMEIYLFRFDLVCDCLSPPGSPSAFRFSP